MKPSDYAAFALSVLMLTSLTALAVIIPALLFMVAWNFVIPALFGGPAITFWHAFCLGVLLSFVRSTLVVNACR
jgi:hypothetical protein